MNRAERMSASDGRERGAALRWGVGFLLVATVATFAFRTSGVAIDDFYITYRYALHLATGRGFVFNPGEHVLGLSNPGLALLLAGLRVVTQEPVERLATAVFASGLLLILASLFAAARMPDRRLEVLGGGLLLASSSFVWKAQGSEVSLALALLLGSACLARRHPFAAGLLGGFAVWVRPDTGLGLAVLFFLLWIVGRSIPWRWCAGCAAVILAGMTASYGYFGAVLPGTLESKRHLAAIVGGSGFAERGFWQVGAETWLHHAGSWGGIVLVASGVVGQVFIFRNWGLVGRLLVGYGGVNALVYPVLGVPFSIWYVFPAVASIYFGVSACGFELGRRLGRALSLRKKAAAGACLLGLLALAIGACEATVRNGGWWLRFEELPRQRAYREAAIWIRGHSRESESIAFGEVGVVGFYSGRPVEDLLGLVTPRSLPFVARRDLVGAFLARPTEWVLYHTRRRSTRPIVRQKWFPKAYRETARFPQSDGEGAVVVFRRRPGAKLPPARPPVGLGPS